MDLEKITEDLRCEEEFAEQQQPHAPNPPLPVKPTPPKKRRQTTKIPMNPPTKNTGLPKITEPEEEGEPPQLKRQKAIAPVKAKKFNMSSMTYFLTFPRYEGNLTKEEMMEKVKTFIKNKMQREPQEIIVALENHAAQEGEEEMGLHFHIAFKLNKKRNVTNANFFDELAGKHGNYKTCKQWNASLIYCAKTGKENYCTYPEDLDIDGIKKATTSKKDSKFSRIAKQIQNGSTLKEINEEEAGFVMQHSKKIIEYQELCETFKEPNLLDWYGVHVPLFNRYPSNWSISNWLNNNIKKPRHHKQKQLYIHGITNMRKTSLVMELAKYLKIYYVPDDNNWYDGYNDNYDLVVFDEFSGQKPLHWMNGFTEGAFYSLNRRGMMPIIKKKNLPVLVLSNRNPKELYEEAQKKSPASFEAFLGRFEIVEVKQVISIDFKDSEIFEMSEEEEPLHREGTPDLI